MARPAPLACAIGLLLLALASVAGAQAAIASLQSVPRESMGALDAVPARVGTWTLVPDRREPVEPMLLDAFGNPVLVYDKIVSRTYARADGRQIMLMLAYQSEQHQEDRIHSPELCYYAQGFVLSDHQTRIVPVGRAKARLRGFTATATGRREEVVYWIRTGTLLDHRSLATRGEIFLKGLQGRLVDGLLVRASMLDLPGDALTDEDRREILSDFLGTLFEASPTRTRAVLAGSDAI